jgi:hypothetical protein
MTKPVSLFLALVFATCFTSVAWAQDARKQRAARLFDKGVASLNAYDYKDALESFTTAYELMPHWRVLAHIGTCYAKLNQPVKAINALERYLEEGSEEVTSEERRTAQSMLAEQRAKVGSLRLSTNLPEAEAKINGEPAGKAPFGRILLLAGPHRVILTAGKDFYEEDVWIEAGKETILHLPRRPGDPPPAPFPSPVVAPVPPPSADTGSTNVEKADHSFSFFPDSSGAVGSDQSRPRRAGTSVAFALSMVFTGLGLGAAVPGWIAYGYHSSSESSFSKATKPLEQDFGYSYDATCRLDDDGNFVVGSEQEKFYCQTEWKRRWYDNNAAKSLIPAIVGTSVTTLGATLSIIFFANAHWFHKDKGKAQGTRRLVLAPVITPQTSGLSLVGTF